MVAPPWEDEIPPPIELPPEAYGGRGGPPPMDDLPPPIDLPTDRPSPQAASHAPPAEPQGAVPEGARLRRAWESMLRDGDGIAPGTLVFLKPARVTFGEGGEVKVELPPGSPVLDRLASAGVKRPMEESLSRRLGGAPVRLSFAATGPAPAAAEHRITAEFARKDRLDRLMEGEPVLAAAVKAWDLELVD